MEKEKYCLELAAYRGHLECLKWVFHALGRSCEKYGGGLYGDAAYGGNLQICTWLMGNGCTTLLMLLAV